MNSVILHWRSAAKGALENIKEDALKITVNIRILRPQKTGAPLKPTLREICLGLFLFFFELS